MLASLEQAGVVTKKRRTSEGNQRNKQAPPSLCKSSVAIPAMFASGREEVGRANFFTRMHTDIQAGSQKTGGLPTGQKYEVLDDLPLYLVGGLLFPPPWFSD